MNFDNAKARFLRILLAASALASIVSSQSSCAETIRFTTWNLDDRTNTVEKAAAALSQLNPDVILLQPVRDWKSASALAEALKPADYSVLVCSAFPARPSDLRSSVQTAILAKRKAYFTWTTPWRVQAESDTPGGFVFAALQAGKRRIGFFSAELDFAITRPPSSRRATISPGLGPAIKQHWTDEITTFRNWSNNRMDRVVVAAFPIPPAVAAGASVASANASRNREDARAAAALLASPLDQPLIAEAPARKNDPPPVLSLATPAAAEDSLSGVIVTRCPLTVDLELNPLPSPVVTQAAPGKDALQTASQDRLRSFTTGIGLIIWVAPTAGLIALLVAAIWVYRRRSVRSMPGSEPVLITAGTGGDAELAGSYTLVLNSPTAETPLHEVSNQEIGSPEDAGSSNLLLESWQRRALSAEHRVAQAQAALRAGALGHLREWIKHHFFRGLLADRSRLLETEQAATLRAMDVNQRLEKIELQVEQQNRAYLERIEKLTSELIAAKEENRELILAQISQVKAEMEAARIRLLSQAGTDA